MAAITSENVLNSFGRPKGENAALYYQEIVKQSRQAASCSCEGHSNSNSKTPHPMYRIKVISMGEASVGKSCLIKRYCEERFVPKYLKTIGVDYGVKRYQFKSTTSASGSVEMRINFWDLSGSSDFVETRTEFYTDAQAAMLVYDVNDRESFRKLATDWLPEARKHLSSSSGSTDKKKSNLVTVVCANKVDTCDAASGVSDLREVSEAEGKKWAQQNGFSYYETSASSGLNVTEMFEQLFRDTYDAKLA